VELPLSTKAKVKKGQIDTLFALFFLFGGHLFTGFDLLGAKPRARNVERVT
jgi:hypothetical protein